MMPSSICATMNSEIGTCVFKTLGDSANVLAFDAFLDAQNGHWLAHEIRHYWKRVSEAH